MKNKGFVQVFSILLVIVCAYQLSFTLRGYQVEQKAKSIAKKTNRSLRDVLDSLGPEKVYNLGIANYTFTQVKERELNRFGAQWARIGSNGSKFNNSKTIGFREKIVKHEMSIYAKTKSLLICVYSVLGEFSRIFFFNYY